MIFRIINKTLYLGSIKLGLKCEHCKKNLHLGSRLRTLKSIGFSDQKIINILFS